MLNKEMPKSISERIRTRPAVIFYSDGIEGCLSAVSCLIKNSIEEAQKGFGRKIIVQRYPDNAVEIIDFGRGIPVEYNEKAKKYEWDINFCQLFSSEFHEQGDYQAQFAVGLHGCELFYVQAVSEYMDAEICRDGYKYNLHFEKGKNIGGLKKEKISGTDSGTRIKFKIDEEVFKDTIIPFEKLNDTVEKLATCNTGIGFDLCFDEKNGTRYSKTYCYNSVGERIQKVNQKNKGEVYEHTAKFSGIDRREIRCQGNVSVAVSFVGESAIRESFFNFRYLKYGGVAVWETEKLIRNEIKKKLNTEGSSEEKIDAFLEKIVKQFSIIACVKMTPNTAVMWETGARDAILNPIVVKTVTCEFEQMIQKMIEESWSEIVKQY